MMGPKSAVLLAIAAAASTAPCAEARNIFSLLHSGRALAQTDSGSAMDETTVAEPPIEVTEEDDTGATTLEDSEEMPEMDTDYGAPPPDDGTDEMDDDVVVDGPEEAVPPEPEIVEPLTVPEPDATEPMPTIGTPTMPGAYGDDMDDGLDTLDIDDAMPPSETDDDAVDMGTDVVEPPMETESDLDMTEVAEPPMEDEETGGDEEDMTDAEAPVEA